MNKITVKATDRFAKAAISFILVLLTLFAPAAEIASAGGLFGVAAYAADSYTYTYYPKTKYTGGSIVDGLKSIGVDSSWSNREKIAAVNGINNYSSTASQNIKLLNLLKSGKLIKSKTLNNSGSAYISNGTYVLCSGLANNKALDVNGCSMDDRANVQLWTLNYSKAQVFKIESLGNGYYVIRNYNSGKVLDVMGNVRAAGTNVAQFTYNGGINQQWRFVSTGGGYYYIESRLGSLYLDVNEARTADGTNVKVWKFNDSTNAQKWKLVKYDLGGGASKTSVKLNVPTLRQTDSRWKNTCYVKGVTIGRSGCLLTCITAAMSCIDGRSYRPDEYYKKLSFTSGGAMYF